MRSFLLLITMTPFLVFSQTGPASGQRIQTPTKTYYNYYDQNGNPYFPGGGSTGQIFPGTPTRVGTKIIYDSGSRSNYNTNATYNPVTGNSPSSSMTGPPGQGRPYREGNKIIYR